MCLNDIQRVARRPGAVCDPAGPAHQGVPPPGQWADVIDTVISLGASLLGVALLWRAFTRFPLWARLGYLPMLLLTLWGYAFVLALVPAEFAAELRCRALGRFVARHTDGAC